MSASGSVRDVTDGDFGQVVFGGAMPVVVDFWAPWCTPCKAVAPIVEQLSAEMAGKVDFAQLNIDDNEIAASQFNITDLPTIVIFSDGEEVGRVVGFAPKERLKRQIEHAIAS